MVVSRSAHRYPVIGGAPKYSMYLASKLLERFPSELEVTFVGQYKPQADRGHLKFIRVGISFDLNVRSRLLYFLKAFILDVIISISAIKEILRDDNFQYVVLNSNIACLLIGLFTKESTELIYVAHDFPMRNPKEHNIFLREIKFVTNYLLEKMAICRSTKIVSVSPGISNAVLATFGRRSVTLTPFPYLLDQIDTFGLANTGGESVIGSLGLNSGEFILTVGFQEKRKMFSVLIKAFSKIEDRNLKLVLVGNGPDNKHLVELVHSLGLTKRVVFLSNVDNSSLRFLYSNTRLFALVSKSEGFPVAVVEALSFGSPVAMFLDDGALKGDDWNFKYFTVESNTDFEYVAKAINDILKSRIGSVERQEIAQWAEKKFNITNYGQAAFRIICG